MNAKTIFIIISFFIFFTGHSQNDPATVKTLLEQADMMGQKFVARDYEAFLKYAHPATIKSMGGQQAALRKMNEQMKQVIEDGIVVTNVSFGIPSKFIKVNSELQCTVPQIIEMHVPGGKVTTTTTMLAISSDNGKTWSFIDTANHNHSNMKLLIPNLSDEIILEPAADPVFEPIETKTE